MIGVTRKSGICWGWLNDFILFSALVYHFLTLGGEFSSSVFPGVSPGIYAEEHGKADTRKVFIVSSEI